MFAAPRSPPLPVTWPPQRVGQTTLPPTWDWTRHDSQRCAPDPRGAYTYGAERGTARPQQQCPSSVCGGHERRDEGRGTQNMRISSGRSGGTGVGGMHSLCHVVTAAAAAAAGHGPAGSTYATTYPTAPIGWSTAQRFVAHGARAYTHDADTPTPENTRQHANTAACTHTQTDTHTHTRARAHTRCKDPTTRPGAKNRRHGRAVDIWTARQAKHGTVHMKDM